MWVWPNLSWARTVSIRLLLRWRPILNVLFWSLGFLPSRAKEFHFQCHPLVMASLSGLIISVWGIALWGAVGALNAASAFSFPQTLTCPGTQHRSMIISSLALQISSLVSTKIGEKEESDLSTKRALLESEKIVNRLPSMVPLKISCTAAFIAYSSAVNIEAFPVSLPPLVVLGNTVAKPTPLVDLEPSINMHRSGPLQVC